MAQTIKLKRSSTGGNVPATGDLALGEMAINTNDGLMFIKKNVSGTETVCTFHPTTDASNTRTLTLDRGSGNTSFTIDFPDNSGTLANTYIDGNAGRISTTAAGMSLEGYGNIGLYTNGSATLGGSSSTQVFIGGSACTNVTIDTSTTGYCKLPSEVRFAPDAIQQNRTDNPYPTFKMKLENVNTSVSNLTFTEGLRVSSYAFGVLHKDAVDIDTPGESYSYTVVTLEGTTQVKLIADYLQSRNDSGYYVQPYTTNSSSKSFKAIGNIELGASANTYPQVIPYSNYRGYLGTSTRQWYQANTYYANIYGLSISGYVDLKDYDILRFGNSDDCRMYYNAGSSNIMYMELEAAAQSFTIVDGSTANTRFTFAKSTGDFTASGNVTAYSDERLKSDIKTLDPSKTLQMRGVEFIKDGKKGSGVVAQELEKVAPELVLDEGDYKSVAYGNLSGYLIETIKDQQKQIDELKELVYKLLEK